MNDQELFTLLRPIVESVTGVPVCILADPNAPAPDGSYAAIKPKQTIIERGQPNIERKNGIGNTVNVDVRAQIIAECTIDFYRGGSRDFAQRLKSANKRPDVSATLFKGGVGWNRTSAVNDLTALQADNQEERSRISIFLMYETVDPVIINSIERMNVIVENEKAETLSTFEIKTPDAPPVL